MSDRPIRMIIASPTQRGALHMSEVLSGFSGFEVMGIATDLRDVLKLLDHSPPDFILLSRKFRGSHDSEVLMALLNERDIRWLELAGRNPQTRPEIVPPSGTSGLFEIDAATPPPLLAQHIRSVCRNMQSPDGTPMARLAATGRPHPLAQKIILIGASTGGVDCLIRLLEGYSSSCPPTLIVQHTGNEFMPSLINLLDRRCPVPVVPATDGTRLEHGRVAVAADGGTHLTMTSQKPFQCRSVTDPPVSGHRPSVDALFRSAAPVARSVLAVLLTGMGRDGAAGMLALKSAGAETIAQDEASSIVYGMPRVAREMGAANHVMALNDIAGVLSGATRLPIHTKGMPQ